MRGHAEILFPRTALLRRARQAKNLLGQIGIAGKGSVRSEQDHVRVETEKAPIGFVRVEHAAAGVGDQCPLRQIIDKGLGDVVAGLALAEMQNADGTREQAEHADDGEAGKDSEDEGLGHLA